MADTSTRSDLPVIDEESRRTDWSSSAGSLVRLDVPVRDVVGIVTSENTLEYSGQLMRAAALLDQQSRDR